MKLPTPPSVEDLRVQTPAVAPVPAGVAQPFWSVMIPSFNCGDYLRRTLTSVLAEAPGPDEMQIEVVDGCSTMDDPEPIVRRLGGDRITFSRLPENRGGPNTFNACIRRSRGQWIHILHGDDMVLPGFYDAYRRLIEATPGAAMICGRFIRIDEGDRWVSIGGINPRPGHIVITDFLENQALKNCVAFPSVVVARGAYEQAGGFCTRFDHVSDMDMWFRIGQLGPVLKCERPLCCYRHHCGSETSKLIVSGSNIRELYDLICVNLARLGRTVSSHGSAWTHDLACFAEGLSWRLYDQQQHSGALEQARWAWALSPTVGRLKLLVKAWLKHRFSRVSTTN